MNATRTAPIAAPRTWYNDAAAMINAGAEEWIDAAVRVGMADDANEGAALYDACDTVMNDTLRDMVVAYWQRNGGYTICPGKGYRYISFAE